MHYELYNLEQGYCTVTMENGKEQREKLMRMMVDAGVTIQKYYWRSKLDDSYIELFEPSIYDVFNFHVDFSGDMNTIKEVMEEYIKIKDTYKHLDKCLEQPLTQEEITDWANKCLKHMEIFC